MMGGGYGGLPKYWVSSLTSTLDLHFKMAAVYIPLVTAVLSKLVVQGTYTRKLSNLEK